MPQAVGPLTVLYYGPPGGNASWYYWVQTIFPGGYTALSPYGVVSQSQPSLNPTMFNVVSWVAVVGATGYKVWRTPTSTPPTTGPYMLAVVDNSTTSVTDNGVNWQISTDTVVVTGPVGGYWQAGTGGAIYYNSGNVGIGTTSPQSLLDLGNAVTPIKLALYSNGPGPVYGMGIGSNELTFGASIDPNTGTPQMVLNSGGRVGIGTTTPAYTLDVNGVCHLYNSGQLLFQPGASGVASVLQFAADASFSGGAALGNGAPGLAVTNDFVFSTLYSGGWVERMRITSTGDVGIGTSSPSHVLELSLDSAAKPGTNTWTIASGAAVKQRVKPLKGGLDVINQLKPVEAEYNGKNGTPKGQRVVSFVAEEIREILPHTVTEDSDGNLGFNIHEVIHQLVLAVQQLSQEVNKLKLA